MTSLRLPGSRRIKRSADFKRVYSCGKKGIGRLMVAWVLPGDEQRLGVVASRKVGNAVHRNRCKRRLREVFRIHQHEVAPASEVVLVARARLYDAEWSAVVAEFLELMSGLAKPSVSGHSTAGSSEASSPGNK